MFGQHSQTVQNLFKCSKYQTQGNKIILLISHVQRIYKKNLCCYIFKGNSSNPKKGRICYQLKLKQFVKRI